MKLRQTRQFIVPRRLAEKQIQHALDAARRNGQLVEARMMKPRKKRAAEKDIVDDFCDAACKLIEDGEAELYSDIFFMEMIYQYRKWWRTLPWHIRLWRRLRWWLRLRRGNKKKED